MHLSPRHGFVLGRFIDYDILFLLLFLLFGDKIHLRQYAISFN